MGKRRAVFLDRDGTINDDPGYVSTPDQMVLFPHAAEAISKLNKAGFLVIIVSNQSGIARGIIEKNTLPKIHARMEELLAKEGAKIDDYFLCFHHPDQHCECRKPKPKLLLDAGEKYPIDFSKSFMVGDRLSDVECGLNAGCKKTFLVRTGYGKEQEEKFDLPKKTVVVEDLSQAVERILKES